ncbi:monocarboxylate transporter 12-like [Patiria miniata]|uniref:Major facilitator superfamily (MFS) profile domain-containing protein n=1 Tax=Patiria miniata TaxID=46514 RepID=A0A913ZEJ0_PATMI|nr:monocarboxylate transporter 12-like [Patiria miniata]XP_038050209.1 monocarboxylate transporter 12-like [Patiria miniata]
MSSTLRTRRGAETQPDDPREGGWGIVVVIAAHLSFAIQNGLLRSPGVLYLSWKEDFSTNDRETAAVQSVFSSVSCFSGLLGGILTERFGCRVTGIVGGVLTFLGHLCTYWVTDIYQLYITASIIGIGIGIASNPVVVVVAMYFKRKYKLAHAVAISGEGTGIMAAPPLFQMVLQSFGWRGTFVIASAVAANIVTFSALFRPNGTKQKSKGGLHSSQQNLAKGEQNSDDNYGHSGGLVQLEPKGQAAEHGETPNSNMGYVSLVLDTKNANPILRLLKRLAVRFGFHLFVKSYRFVLLCAIQLQFNITYIGFVLYLVPRAQSVGVAPSSAVILLSIFGIGNLLGRLGSGLLVSWKILAEHVSAITMVIAGVSLLIMISERFSLFAIASFLYGFVSGVYFAIGFVLIRQCVGVRKLAVGVGFSQIFLGIGAVTGPVVAGWILDLTGDSYQTVYCVESAICFIGAVQMLLVPLLRRIEPGIEISPTDV